MSYSSLRMLLTKRFDIPKERFIKKAIRSFTLAEKTVFYLFVAIFIISGLLLASDVNKEFLVEVPLRGGNLVEGVVGNPRFINPVLAMSEADRDLTTLVYSGLVRKNSNGEIVNDLAEDVSISTDSLTYTVRLRPDAVFHDNEPVTSDDVEFTIKKILNPALRSPLFGNWSSVAIHKIDEHTISFTLKKPYAPFMEILTVGILPKHIWNNVSDDEFYFSQFNSLPIGSGPYKIDVVERNSGGIPDYYDLTPFEKAVGGVPFIEHLVFRFYPNENGLLDAYDSGEIESMGGISPQNAIALKKSGGEVVAAPLPRVFGVFFNQNQSGVLLNKEVRRALDLATPKESIVENVLLGYATPIDGPLPAGVYPWTSRRATTTDYEERFAMAQNILSNAGWERNPESGILEKKSRTGTLTLSFSISTGNAPELKAVAAELAEAWQKLGASVDVLLFETGDLNQNVIRPRRFDALLFGEMVGRDVDMYPFWHSSERNDPGLNIALYANSSVDKKLENIRTTVDPVQKEALLHEFDEEIRSDIPAVFLYTPSFLYTIPDKIHALSLGNIATPKDRFQDIRDWYIETNKVWKIFVE